MLVFLILSLLLNIALIYSSIVSLRKIEYYEDRIMWFYTQSNKILTTMRILDSREMFEKDDEVGQVFQQLTTTIGNLRTLIYDTQENEEEIF